MTLLDHLEWIDAQASSGVSGGPVASKTSAGRTGTSSTESLWRIWSASDEAGGASSMTGSPKS
jgi:hypothetical protein